MEKTERTAMTTKSQIILDLDHRGPRGEVVFRQYGEDDPIEINHEYRMNAQAWESMENPAVITLTVQPGDLLNDTTSGLWHKTNAERD